MLYALVEVKKINSGKKHFSLVMSSENKTELTLKMHEKVASDPDGMFSKYGFNPRCNFERVATQFEPRNFVEFYIQEMSRFNMLKNRQAQAGKTNKEIPFDFSDVCSRLTAKEAAIYYGCSNATIRKWSEETGHKPLAGQDGKRASRGRNRYPIPDDFEEMAAKIQNRRKLAAHYGLSSTIIYRWLNELGIQKKRKNPEYTLPDAFKSVAMELSTKELCDKYGVSATTVNRWRDLVGLEDQFDHPCSHRVVPEGFAEFCKTAPTFESIMKEYGIDRITLKRWIKESGVDYVSTNVTAFKMQRPDNLQKLLESYTVRQIAVMFDVSDYTVYNWRLGIMA